MKLRFKFRQRGAPKGARPRTVTVKVPGRQMIALMTRRGLMPLEIAPDFIAAFEARHSAEVLEVRRPARRVRA